MKIAWFTPFHLQSAIGHVGKSVCEELQKSCSVDIYTFNHKDIIDSTVNVIRCDSANFNIGLLGQYDFVVYNMGNFAGNHREIWQVMQQHPGILLQHDQIMNQFFSQLTLEPQYGGDLELGESKYAELMENCYGEQGRLAAAGLFRSYFGEKLSRIWDSAEVIAYPLIEPLLKNATGVFSHAAFFIQQMKRDFYGSTGYAYLPHVSALAETQEELPPEFDQPGKALVVSNGIVHPVKRIVQVAEMLLARPDIAKRVQYVVIGSYGGEYGMYLETLAKGPLRGCLYLAGYLPANIMEVFLRKAAFCVNLRYPNSEVCSKSLIEQMAFAKPVVVLTSGIFGEIPDNCVVKIRLENETSELADAFVFLLDHPDQKREIGTRAADFVASNCTPKMYVSRFMSFLQKVPAANVANTLVHECIDLSRSALRGLLFNQSLIPELFESATRTLAEISNATMPGRSGSQTLGVWLAFPYKLNFRREGITRFLLYMLIALLEQYSIDCEIWTYSINEEEVWAGFDLLLKDERFNGRIKLITEKNYQDHLDIPLSKRNIPLEVNETLDNLPDIAREYSCATAFVTAIVYLDNVIRTGKQVFVPVHDLGIHVHYDDFVANDPFYKARHVDIRSRAENFARSGAFMFSNSEYVRQEQVLRYVSSLHPARTDVVYLPVNIPKNLQAHLLDEKSLREKFGLKKAYIFYPTQVRPYKNISVLVNALQILLGRNIDIDLVLTGSPSDVPDVYNAIRKYDLSDRVISLPAVAENELYSLYRYAAAAAVPTLFEGGFPWQACEALFMDAPLALSDIPVVRERIEFHGMSTEKCGLGLFDPHDPRACANALEKIIRNREATLSAQKTFKDKFLSYSWTEAAAHYYRLFFGSSEN